MSEKFRETAHFHGDGMFGYEYTSLARPRLSFKETCYRKDRSTVRVWRVDGSDIAHEQIEDALAKPPVLTDEESAALAQISTVWADRRKDFPYGVLLGLRQKGMIEAQAGKVRLLTPDAAASTETSR